MSKQILFGEAKYVNDKNAYGKALKQINKFYVDKQHITDIPDIENFFCAESFEYCHKDEIGYMIAFSSKGLDTATLIANIKKNSDYNALKKFKEIILIAVNI